MIQKVSNNMIRVFHKKTYTKYEKGFLVSRILAQKKLDLIILQLYFFTDSIGSIEENVIKCLVYSINKCLLLIVSVLGIGKTYFISLYSERSNQKRVTAMLFSFHY